MQIILILDFDAIREQTDDLSDLSNVNDGASNDDRSLNGLFDDTFMKSNNGEFVWRRTDGTLIQNLYRLIELRPDTSTTGTGNILFINHAIHHSFLCIPLY